MFTNSSTFHQFNIITIIIHFVQLIISIRGRRRMKRNLSLLSLLSLFSPHFCRKDFSSYFFHFVLFVVGIKESVWRQKVKIKIEMKTSYLFSCMLLLYVTTFHKYKKFQVSSSLRETSIKVKGDRGGGKKNRQKNEELIYLRQKLRFSLTFSTLRFFL